jgi:hypothetical protein
MPNAPIFRYYVTVRLSNITGDSRSFHIDACTKTGAFYQTWRLLKKHNVESVWSITIRHKAYPVAKQNLIKERRKQLEREAQRVDNLQTIKAIKVYADSHPPKV